MQVSWSGGLERRKEMMGHVVTNDRWKARLDEVLMQSRRKATRY